MRRFLPTLPGGNLKSSSAKNELFEVVPIAAEPAVTTEKGIRVGMNAGTSRRCVAVEWQKPFLFQMVVLCCDRIL